MARLTYEELEKRVKELEAESIKLKQNDKGINFEAIFRFIPLAGFIWRKMGDDFVLVDFNDAAGVFYHGTVAKFVGNKAREMYSDMPEILRNLSRCFSEKKTIRHELQYLFRTTGESRYLVAWYAFVPPDIVSVHTEDVTDRKFAENALRESEEKYRVLFETAQDAIFVTDDRGRFVDVNHAACESLGYTREELLQLSNREIDDDSIGYEAFLKVRDGKVDKITFQVNQRKKDGTLLPVEISGALIPTKGQRMSLAFVRDITERKRFEAQLQRAQKMEAIGTLAGGIAHDFNNLLMTIQGNVSLMGMDTDPSHSYYEKIMNIEKQIKSGSKLTSQLLGYARKGKYIVEPININQLIEETLDTFGRTRREISIHKELEGKLFAVEADKGQIEQVLLNLYINAADAMPGGGVLKLKTENTTNRDIKDRLYNPKPGNYIVLSVIDNGIGMDEGTIKQVFDPFFTTKTMGRGTGIGLASVYGIIKAHAGYIDVESRKRKGTTFTIYLPASERQVENSSTIVRKLSKATGTVLLVDDEKDMIEVSKQLLEAMGFKVLTAGNGEDAIRIYKENQGNIDIVLLDMIMPEISGGEAYDLIKEINPEAKVLLISGYSIDGQASEILKRGCNGFVQKPFNMVELSNKIDKILQDSRTNRIGFKK
ncbi:MAG: PAS domain S-box protein [Desulfobacterales bacterium]|nr:PAS domain S-box protein [Desulfobacterales bacterium]